MITRLFYALWDFVIAGLLTLYLAAIRIVLFMTLAGLLAAAIPWLVRH